MQLTWIGIEGVLDSLSIQFHMQRPRLRKFRFMSWKLLLINTEAFPYRRKLALAIDRCNLSAHRGETWGNRNESSKWGLWWIRAGHWASPSWLCCDFGKEGPGWPYHPIFKANLEIQILFFIYFLLIFKNFNYSWFTTFCQFLLHSKGTQLHQHMHSFSHIYLNGKFKLQLLITSLRIWIILMAISLLSLRETVYGFSNYSFFTIGINHSSTLTCDGWITGCSGKLPGGHLKLCFKQASPIEQICFYECLWIYLFPVKVVLLVEMLQLVLGIPGTAIARDGWENSHCTPKKTPTKILHGKVCLQIVTFKASFRVQICIIFAIYLVHTDTVDELINMFLCLWRAPCYPGCPDPFSGPLRLPPTCRH